MVGGEIPEIDCLQETHVSIKNQHILKVKGWEKIFQVSGKQKRVAVAIFILD